jgi:hypothetical protein
MSELRGAIYPDLEGKTVLVTGGATCTAQHYVVDGGWA